MNTSLKHNSMSKQIKLSARLNKIPPPRDFTWNELINLTRQAGFTETCRGGSHYMFEHFSGFRFAMSRTHPSGILKIYQIKEAIHALNTVKFKWE